MTTLRVQECLYDAVTAGIIPSVTEGAGHRHNTRPRREYRVGLQEAPNAFFMVVNPTAAFR